MFARVSHVRYPPEHHDAGLRVVVEDLLPALRRAPGYRGCCLLAGGKPGTGLAVVLWETEEAADAASADRAVTRGAREARRARAGDRVAEDLRGRRPRRVWPEPVPAKGELATVAICPSGQPIGTNGGRRSGRVEERKRRRLGSWSCGRRAGRAAVVDRAELGDPKRRRGIAARRSTHMQRHNSVSPTNLSRRGAIGALSVSAAALAALGFAARGRDALAQDATPSAEDAKAVVNRLYEEVFNQKRMDVLDGVFAADLVDHTGGPQGGWGAKGPVLAIMAAIPDLHVTPGPWVIEGDLVTTLVTFHGHAPGGLPRGARHRPAGVVVAHRHPSGAGRQDCGGLAPGSGHGGPARARLPTRPADRGEAGHADPITDNRSAHEDGSGKFSARRAAWIERNRRKKEHSHAAPQCPFRTPV